MKRATWTLMLAGLLTGGLGLHLIVTQPLHRQIDSLTAAVSELQSGLRQVADYRDEVAGTNDLLSKLQDQGSRLAQARTALESVRQLEREVTSQSRSSRNALAAMGELARVHNELLAQSERIEAMEQTLDQLGQYHRRVQEVAGQAADQFSGLNHAVVVVTRLGELKDRVVAESDGIDAAHTHVARLIGLKNTAEQIEQADIERARGRLSDLAALKQDLLERGNQIPQARQNSDQLIALKENLARNGTRARVAQKHAAQLLHVEEVLAADAGNDINAATQNLSQLIKMEETLAAQDEQLVRAVESLELMHDLHEEFHRRTQDMESIRRGLTELVMMESHVARTVRSLEPLTELVNLRRLDADQLRSIAQSLIDQRDQRVATGDPPISADGRPPVTASEEGPVPPPPTRR